MPPVLGPAIVVEDAFVILRGHQRHGVLAVGDDEERNFRPCEALLEDDAAAGIAEGAIDHRRTDGPPRLRSRVSATTTPLPAARPSALTTSESPNSPLRIADRASSAVSQTR